MVISPYNYYLFCHTAVEFSLYIVRARVKVPDTFYKPGRGTKGWRLGRAEISWFELGKDWPRKRANIMAKEVIRT